MSSNVIKCHQMSSNFINVIKCHKMWSNVIKCDQMSSNVIKCHQISLMSSNVIKCHQMSSNVIKCHQMSSNCRTKRIYTSMNLKTLFGATKYFFVFYLPKSLFLWWFFQGSLSCIWTYIVLQLLYWQTCHSW